MTTDAKAQLIERVRTMTRGPVAPLRHRRLLAFGYLAAIGVVIAGALIAGRVGGLVSGLGVVAAATLLVRLRKATRCLADAPSEALDELLARIQADCYTFAYQLLGVVVVITSALLLFAATWPGSTGVPAAPALAAAWLLLGVGIAAPVLVMAITLPDVDPEPAGCGNCSTCTGAHCGTAPA